MVTLLAVNGTGGNSFVGDNSNTAALYSSAPPASTPTGYYGTTDTYGLAVNNGQYWRNQRGSYIDPRDWNGWDPTMSNDVSQIVQQCHYESQMLAMPVWWPSGAYLLSTTIRAVSWYFAQVRAYGSGGMIAPSRSGAPTYGIQVPQQPNTFFYSPAIDRPGWTVDWSRGCQFGDFSITGGNVAPNGVVAPHDVVGDYCVPNAANGRYSSNVGWMVDGLNCAVPADGGFTALQGITGTATITAGSSNIQFSGGNPGIVIGNSIRFASTVGNLSSATTYFVTYASPFDYAGTFYIQVYTAPNINHSIVASGSGSVSTTSSWYYGSTVDGSSNNHAYNMNITNFVVGWGHCMSGVGSQSDFFKWDGVYINYCDTNVAIGQGQSKSCNMFGGSLGMNSRQCFDGTTYGAQDGWPINTHGTGLQAYRLISYADNVGPCYLNAPYGENLSTIGNWGTGDSTDREPLTIVGGQLQLRVNGNFGTPPPVDLEAYGGVTVKGTKLPTNNVLATRAYTLCAGSVPIVLDGAELSGTSTAGYEVPVIGFGDENLGGAVATSPSVLLRDVYCSGTGVAQYVSDVDAPLSLIIAASNRLVTSWQQQLKHDNTNHYSIQPGSASGTLAITVSSLTMLTTAITFTAAPQAGSFSQNINTNWTQPTGWYPLTFGDSVTTRQAFMTLNQPTCVWGSVAGQLGLGTSQTTSAVIGNTGLSAVCTTPYLLQAGDFFLWKMLKQGASTNQMTVPTVQVAAISGNNITFSFPRQATEYDTVANQASSTVMTMVGMQPWAPGASLTATVDGTTNVIVVNTPGMLKVGYFVKGTGLATNSRVTAISGNNVTLNQNTTAAGSGVRIYNGQALVSTTSAEW